MYELLFSREPSQTELDLGLEYLQQSSADEMLWRDYTQALFAINELMFVD